MKIDVLIYHRLAKLIGLAPNLDKISFVFFGIMMLYLKICSFAGKSRERFMEYTWVLKNAEQGDWCLNVGCGDSLLDYALSARFLNYTSIDLKKFSVVVKNPKIHFVQTDITYVPFRRGIFRTILCISTLEHIEDDYGAIREMSRITMPRGKIYVSVPIEDSFYSEESIIELIGNVGLKVVYKDIILIEGNRKICMIISTKE